MEKRNEVVVKALIRRDNEFLILKKAGKEASVTAGWETPGGHLENDEEVINGLLREIKEETELNAKILFPFNIYKTTLENGGSVIGINYLAEWVSGEPKISEEHTEWKWANISEIRMLRESLGLQKEMDAYESFLELK